MKAMRAAASGSLRGPRGGIFHLSASGKRVSGPAPTPDKKTTQIVSHTSALPIKKPLQPADKVVIKTAPHLEHHKAAFAREIESAHADLAKHGLLPKLVRPLVVKLEELGEEFGGGFHKDDGTIVINKSLLQNKTLLRNTLIHEIGHKIDYDGLAAVPDRHHTYGLAAGHDTLKQWAGDSRGGRLRADQKMFAESVLGTEKIRRLTEMAIHGEAAAVREHANYLLEPSELWARAYHQYAATKLGDHTIEQDSNAALPTQWTKKEFVPIAKAIEKVLAEGSIYD